MTNRFFDASNQCTEGGCTQMVPDRAWEQGHRVCKMHFIQAGDWVVEAVGIDPASPEQAVIAQHNPRDRWNGWLTPRMDPLGIVNILERVVNPPDLDPEYRVEIDWRDDGTLVVTEKFAEQEDGDDYEPWTITPDEDGLYEFMGGSWTWSGYDDFYEVRDGHIFDRFTDEWNTWAAARSDVRISAHNRNNRTLAEMGVMDRLARNEEAGNAAVAEWELTHPEPEKHRTQEA